ncbi:alpha/beta fold hydrolase [Streptomyces olivochromogenes]|uniref:alpha/beta fold hydrolase n=1 Tax=Streptomyces olivochromogenes TaxID=1963 RepID=UPI0036DF4352
MRVVAAGDAVELFQQFLPDAELIIYPDANHGAHFQYPDRFVTYTKLFLDR